MHSSRNALRAALLALALSLTGCATSLPPPPLVTVQPVQIPPPSPELMEEPDLSVSYSELVQRLFLEWRARLTDWRRGS